MSPAPTKEDAMEAMVQLGEMSAGYVEALLRVLAEPSEANHLEAARGIQRLAKALIRVNEVGTAEREGLSNG